MFQSLKSGQEVAVIPTKKSSPAETLHLAIVKYVGTVIVQLTDGRIYATNDGQPFSLEDFGFIVPATDAHRAAVNSA